VTSDDIDAVRAARQALAGVGLSVPRRRGDREAMRVLLATRGQVSAYDLLCRSPYDLTCRSVSAR
jgi:hypothetical protein